MCIRDRVMRVFCQVTTDLYFEVGAELETTISLKKQFVAEEDCRIALFQCWMAHGCRNTLRQPGEDRCGAEFETPLAKG